MKIVMSETVFDYVRVFAYRSVNLFLMKNIFYVRNKFLVAFAKTRPIYIELKRTVCPTFGWPFADSLLE